MRITKTIDLLPALSDKTRGHVREIYETLTGAGSECYLVGGCVRDLVMGRPIGDIDIATNAHPKTVVKLFRRTVPTGLKHGTITVLFDDQSYEVTTFRAEGTYSDARHPDEVRFSQSLSEDLQRRDFTMNALAFDPGRREIIDEHGGLEDIAGRRIRTIGSAQERFFEDALRPVRACRFSAALEFEIEDTTRSALADSRLHERARKVAVERFTDEMYKGFRAPLVSRMISALEESGLLGLFLMLPDAPTPPSVLAEIDRFYPAPPEVRIALWWNRCGLSVSEGIRSHGRRLKLSNDAVRDIENTSALLLLLAGTWRPLSAWPEDGLAEKRIERRFFLSDLKRLYKEETGAFLTKLRPLNGVMVSTLLRIVEKEPLVAADLDIRGEDLMTLGLQGPKLGSCLQQLLVGVLSGTIENTREKLLAKARLSL